MKLIPGLAFVLSLTAFAADVPSAPIANNCFHFTMNGTGVLFEDVNIWQPR